MSMYISQESIARLEKMLSHGCGQSALDLVLGRYPEWLTYDDVAIIPNAKGNGDDCATRHPREYNLACEIAPGVFIEPAIISAPMATVTEARMAIFLRKVAELYGKPDAPGAIGVIHRAWMARNHELSCEEVMRHGIERSVREYCAACNEGANPFMAVGMSVGMAHVDALVRADCRRICVDVAKGDDARVLAFIREIRTRHPNVVIMGGNVGEPNGAIAVAEAGAHTIRCSIGTGQVCTTGSATGVYTPSFSAVALCAAAIAVRAKTLRHSDGWVPTIIADGNIRTSGDVVKAIAAGAAAVMIGSLFAGYDEAPGEARRIPGRDGLWVEHYGMASEIAANNMRGASDTPAFAIEGAATLVPHRGKLAIFMETFLRGITSGMSYCGTNSFAALPRIARFGLLSQAGMMERQPTAAL